MRVRGLLQLVQEVLKLYSYINPVSWIRLWVVNGTGRRILTNEESLVKTLYVPEVTMVPLSGILEFQSELEVSVFLKNLTSDASVVFFRSLYLNSEDQPLQESA